MAPNAAIPFELAAAAEWFARLGIPTEPGLNADELSAIEQRYRFTFPPDLRALLSRCLPVGEGWPDWRHAPEAVLRDKLDWPLEGMEFDLEHNTFWLPEWGPCPAALAERCAVARSAVAAAPRLIPIFIHRYIPDRPNLPGNPVFSVHQTDIIYYGHDLASYLEGEFGGGALWEVEPPLRRIEFWSRIVEYQDECFAQYQAESEARRNDSGD